MRQHAAGRAASVAAIAAGLNIGFGLGLTETFARALALAFGCDLLGGALLRSWRELWLVPFAVALGTAVTITALRSDTSPSNDFPLTAAWVLTAGSLIPPAVLGAAALLVVARRPRRHPTD